MWGFIALLAGWHQALWAQRDLFLFKGKTSPGISLAPSWKTERNWRLVEGRWWEGKQDRSAVKLRLNWQGKEPGSTLPCWYSLTVPGRGCLLPLSTGWAAGVGGQRPGEQLPKSSTWGTYSPTYAPGSVSPLPNPSSSSSLCSHSSWGLSSSLPTLAGHCCSWGAAALAKFMPLQLAAEDKAPVAVFAVVRSMLVVLHSCPTLQCWGLVWHRVLAALHILSWLLLESCLHLSEDSSARRGWTSLWKSSLVDPEHA